MRRWLLRILIITAVLLLMAAATVQIVLWSDWPRQRVIADLQAETGLVIDAASLRSGWRGRSVLRDVRIGLPLADEPMIELTELTVHHTPLIAMLFTRRVDIQSLRSQHATLRLVEDELGQWNVQQLIGILQERAQRKTALRRSAPHLPQVDFSNVSVSLHRSGRERSDLPMLHFSGSSDAAMVWQFRGELKSKITISGRISPALHWTHQASIQTQDVQDLARLFLEQETMAPVLLVADWRGRLQDDQWHARINVQQFKAASASLTGEAAIMIHDSSIVIDEPQLIIAHETLPFDRAHVTSGTLRFANRTLHADRLQLTSDDLQNTANVSGQFDFQRRGGTATINWSGLLADGPVHSGSVDLAAEFPPFGPKRVTADVQSRLDVYSGQLNAGLRVSASGPEFDAFEGQASFSLLTWRDDHRRVDLSGLQIRGAFEWPQIRLWSLQLPNAQADGSIQFNAQTHVWSADLSLQQWTVPLQTQFITDPVRLALQAWGNNAGVEIGSLQFSIGDLSLAGNGFYTPGETQSIGGVAMISLSLPSAPVQPPPPSIAAATQPLRSPLLPARADIQLQISGHHQPLAVDLNGTLAANSVSTPGGAIGPVNIPWTGRVNSDQVTIQSQPFEILRGKAVISGQYNQRTRLVQAEMQCTSLSLKDVASAFAAPVAIDGTLQVHAHVSGPVRDLQALSASGSWSGSDIQTTAGLIRSATGAFDLKHQTLNLHDMSLLHADGSGKITAWAEYGLRNQQLSFTGTSQNWPLQVHDEARLAINSTSDLQIDLRNRHMRGRADVTASAFLRDQPLGQVAANVTAHQRTLELANLQAHLLNGSVTGAATIPLDQWQQTRADLVWNDIDLAMLGDFLPALESLEGIAAGSAHLKPADDGRALAPLRIDLTNHTRDARMRSVTIGEAALTGFVGKSGVTVDRGRLHLAQGVVDLWARLAWHASEPFVHANAQFSDLNLDELAHWARPTLDHVPGRVNGQATAGGYLTTPHRMFGQATITLSESDLINIPAISLIHNTLNLHIGEIEPEGVGTAMIRLEGNSLELSRMEYFNRGTDIAASLRIVDITKGGESDIEGVAVGAVRPLKHLEIPFFNDLDRALKAVQTGASSVRISGTLAEPREEVVPFAEISGAVRRIFSGSAR